VQGQDGLAVFGEHHEIGFPMAWHRAIVDGKRTFCNGNAGFDMKH
jgi:hypothetical protein